MFKKKITTEKELQEALDKLYKKVDKKVVEKFTKNPEVERKNLKHTVTGCSNCPFVRVQTDMLDSKPKHVVHCLWDKDKNDIESFAKGEKIVPLSCPMIENNIEINLSDGDE